MSGVRIELTLTLSEEQLREIAARVAETTGARGHELDGYLDVQGAAEFLACPKSRIYALVSSRRIPFEKDGSRTLFSRTALREWVRNGGGRRP